jgi:protocatechuate 3,4-dioxygenase beta subunit
MKSELVKYNWLDWKVQPPYLHSAYKSTAKRSPSRPLVPLTQSLSELTGPVYGHDEIQPLDNDLTKNSVKTGEPLGERIIVTGQLLDDRGKPIRNALIEIWQANSAGRYMHKVDQHDAPLDPNFHGTGRVFTDGQGRYRFLTIRPGAYPWPNHKNAWRPNHIHFSYFGPAFATRLITQMYFPGDPLLAFDPIFHAVPDEHARNRLIAVFYLDITEPDYALGYRFDVALRGRAATPMEG